MIADVDTGLGNALNVRRTVRAVERAGAAAIQLEDQIFPKRCGHFSGKAVVPTRQMVGELRAALEARRDETLVVIARTDALAVEGLGATVGRALEYVGAGADLVFVEAPRDQAELAMLPRRIAAPLVANLVEGGLTPLLSVRELGAPGYRLLLFANTALKVGAAAMRDAFQELYATGDERGLVEHMLSWPDRQALVGLPEREALAAPYEEQAASRGVPAARRVP